MFSIERNVIASFMPAVGFRDVQSYVLVCVVDPGGEIRRGSSAHHIEHSSRQTANHVHVDHGGDRGQRHRRLVDEVARSEEPELLAGKGHEQYGSLESLLVALE